MKMITFKHVRFPDVENWKNILRFDGAVEIKVVPSSDKDVDLVALFPDDISEPDYLAARTDTQATAG